jgi:hypothetical protein
MSGFPGMRAQGGSSVPQTIQRYLPCTLEDLYTGELTVHDYIQLLSLPSTLQNLFCNTSFYAVCVRSISKRFAFNL